MNEILEVKWWKPLTIKGRLTVQLVIRANSKGSKIKLNSELLGSCLVENMKLAV